MASQMVVAPSKDTLFIRGFSSRKDVEDVRDFFEKESRSKVMIEFLKQTEQDDRLFVALRFESKDIAKEMLNRYDNSEVLGDKITLTWFKDLRRARYKDRSDNRRPRYDNYDNYGHGGGYNNRYNSHNNRNRMDNRNRNRRRYSRSQSRSESKSLSRSRSRERERDTRRESRSPSPHRRHKLKSEVQTASRQKVDDSDNEPSSPLKESSVSPERAYNSEPRSPSNDRGGKEFTPSPRESSKKSSSQTHESKSSRRNEHKDNHDDDLDYKEETPNRYHKRESLSESYEDNHYHDDKYSSRQQHNRSQQSRYEDDHRGQDSQSKSGSRYPGDVDERALMEGRWSSQVDPSPSRMSEGNERTSTASMDRDRVLASNMERGSHGDRMPSVDMDSGGPERRGDGRKGQTDRGMGGARMDSEDQRRRPYENDNNMWETGVPQGRRNDSFYDPLNEQQRGVPGSKMGGDSDRWLTGIDGPQMGARWGKDGPSAVGGWSQPAMQLIQDKKDDIEKVYKNDCETFVSVVKMLISKDPLLEDRLQHSLRENLKEIGQRCILELREFIDRLRDKEESMNQMTGVPIV